MSKHTILFLAANPLGTDRLALDQEARAIQAELERTGHRDRFELVTRWAVQPLDLLRELRRLKPTIVHFSGHGGRGAVRAGNGPGRDVASAGDEVGGEPMDGLFFQGADGRPQLVSTAAIAETFGAIGGSVKVVVLSACYSEAQAAALMEHIEAVVGMAGTIGDAPARVFAVGFYGGLGEGEQVAAAFRQGCAAVRLIALDGGCTPQLVAREGIDAERLVLADSAAGPFQRLRSGHLLAGAVFVMAASSVALSLFLQRSDSPAIARTVPHVDCDEADAASAICAYRGTLRWIDGAPAAGVKMELMGTDCINVTSESGGFDFGGCDFDRTRHLLHPRIFLHLSDGVRCKEIPLQLPPLMTEARLDLATCGKGGISVATARAPTSASVRIAVRDVERCAELEVKQRWQELHDCAAAMEAGAAKNKALRDTVEEFRQKAIRETVAALVSEKFQVALRDGNLRQAQEQLRAMSADSVYYPASSEAFRAAETRASDDARRKAGAFAAAHDCQGIRRLQAQLATSSTLVVTRAIAAVKCSPGSDKSVGAGGDGPVHAAATPATPSLDSPTPTAPKSNLCDWLDIDYLMEEAQKKFSAGFSRMALSLVTKALGCKQDVQMYRYAVTYACLAHDAAAAKLYFSKVLPQDQPPLIQKCQEENITVP